MLCIRLVKVQVLRVVVLFVRVFVVNHLFPIQRATNLFRLHFSMFKNITILACIRVIWVMKKNVSVLVNHSTAFP